MTEKKKDDKPHYISPRVVESFGQEIIIDQNLDNELGARYKI